MAKPSKGIAQTLQDVLGNLQAQVKEKTAALNAADKKIAALSGGKGGDFTVELDDEKNKRAQTEKLFKEAKAEISKLKEQVEKGSSNGKGASSEDLAKETEKRIKLEKDLAERNEKLLMVNKKLQAETKARTKVESALKNASDNGGGISEAEHQSEITQREQAEEALKEAESKLQAALANPGSGQDSEEMEAIQQEMASLLETQESLAEEKAGLETQLKDAQAELAEASGGGDAQALQEELNSIQQSKDKLQAVNITLETQLKETQFKAEQAEAGNKENAAAVQKLRGENQTLNADKALTEKKVKDLQTQVEAARKNLGAEAALKAERNKLEAQVRNLQAKLKIASNATTFATPPPEPEPAAPKSNTPADKEIERLKQVIARNPRDIKSMVKMAQAAFKASRPKEAVEPLKKAVKLQPKDAELYFLLGDAHYKAQLYHDALGPLNQAVRINPKMAKAHYNLCLINELVGNEEAAQKHYQLAIKIDPDIESKIGS